jgi:hypothetical protein
MIVLERALTTSFELSLLIDITRVHHGCSTAPLGGGSGVN